MLTKPPRMSRRRWNTMSKYFQKVKSYYDAGLWSINRVRDAVVKGWITETEFVLITDEEYGKEEAT
jgi:hypothetical protein